MTVDPVTFDQAYALVMWAGALVCFGIGLRYGQELLKL